MRQLFFYYLLRPVVGCLPRGAWVAGVNAWSLVWGMVLFVGAGQEIRQALTTTRGAAGVVARLRFARRYAVERMRHLEYYLYDGRIRTRTVWHGPVATSPCVYIGCSLLGGEAIGKWLDDHDAVLMRRAWGDELKPAVAVREVPPTQRWEAYCALVRRRDSIGRVVIVGESALQYRQLLLRGQSIVINQDIWDPNAAAGEDDVMFLGRRTPLKIGALRLAKRAGSWPVRFVSLRHNGGVWEFHVGPPLKQCPETIARREEHEIRRRPESWQLWKPWFAYVATTATARTVQSSREPSLRTAR